MIQSLTNDAIHALLSPETNIVYEVPRYQRGYSWGADQWDELFDDLLDHDQTDGHFLGTIICVNSTSNTTFESVLEVIDGQQRLTTISLMLAAIYSLLQERKAELDEEQLVDLLNLKRMLVLKDPVRLRLRPQTQHRNADDYEYVLHEAGLIAEAKYPKYMGNRRVKRAFAHFRDRIEKLAADRGAAVSAAAVDLLGRLKRANIVKLEVNNHADAFTLFESLNNRGMPLTPIDLIKNSLLGKADKLRPGAADEAYERWSEWLELLGDDYGNQERFFRYYYNAMKDEHGFAIRNITVATRSNLIRIYEKLIADDLEGLLKHVTQGVEAFSVLLGTNRSGSRSALEHALSRLNRAQGSPAHILLIYLIIKQKDIDLDDEELKQIVDLLTSFFVRRNLTGVPATYSLAALFMEIVSKLRVAEAKDRKSVILKDLTAVSASDEVFLDALRGPVYEVKADVARFILVSLAERKMTNENRQDLWKRVETKGRPRFLWSIEHILPQGSNLSDDWIEMLGGREQALDAQEQFVHQLGNLTITGYNSSLGARSFAAKRDHRDSSGNPIGYKNGLSLNEELAQRESWGVADIRRRTEELAAQTMAEFPLSYERLTVAKKPSEISI